MDEKEIGFGGYSLDSLTEGHPVITDVKKNPLKISESQMADVRVIRGGTEEIQRARTMSAGGGQKIEEIKFKDETVTKGRGYRESEEFKSKKFFNENRIVKEDIEYIAEGIVDIAPKLEGKTILITGGAGFLGKYIVLSLDYLNKNFFEEPCKVIILDNFITGLPGMLEENDYLKIIKQDISQPFNIDEEIDYVIHAACLASPMFYNRYRLETIDVGFLGTKNMLNLARKKHVRSFLYFSSSEIYGDPFKEFIPTKEDYRGNVSCTGPRACYDEPKRIGETLCMNYGDIFGVPVKIVRPFNIFGPGMRLDDNRVITNFVVKALRGEKVPLYGDGMKSRTFCYISDATIGWFKVLLSDHNRESFNIGHPEQEIRMKHLAEMILALVENDKAEIELIDDKTGIYGGESDPNRRCPDITKAKTMLDYHPRINLITGIKRFIFWVKEFMDVN